jgi:acetate kinase
MSQTSNIILSLNSGSSSLKFAFYRLDGRAQELLARGAAERIGFDDGQLHLKDSSGKMLINEEQNFDDHQHAVRSVIETLQRTGIGRPDAVGHRVVHGGSDLIEPALVKQNILRRLKELIPFAPLHLPTEIQVIEAVEHHFGDVPQVACFDTAFHRTMPETSKRLPIPEDVSHQGVIRYGFHGLSCEYIVSELKPSAQARTVIAHLGNGCSLTAVKGSCSVDTTMGFTPAGGVMMGTRTGDLDPGVCLFLLRQKGYDASKLDDLVNNRSGLLGVSSISSDMKTLLDNRAGNPKAALAVELFCFQVRKAIGSLAAVLGGLDTLVFTGGIGERAAVVRSTICEGLDFFGVSLDPEKNEANADIISSDAPSCLVRVMQTKEELIIARHTYKLLNT